MSILPPEVRGRGTGFWTGMFFLGQFLAPFVVVALYKLVGGLGNVLVVYGVVAVFLIIVSAIASRGAPVLTHSR